ncbi:MAG: OmpH family outer membrane protein [Planctomycetota bacterium]|nr:OmpH family outer membrane protein [Planctomycetota bacterium]
MRSYERFAMWSGLVLVALLLLRQGPVSTSLAGLEDAEKPPRIAVCAVVKIVDELMDSDRFKPARVEHEDQLRREMLDPLRDRLREVQEEARDLKSDDPRAAELSAEFRRLQQQAQRVQQEVVQKMEAKIGEQLVECYGLVRSSAVAIAEQKGFTYVLASADPEDQLNVETVMKLVRDFLSRPVLMAPAEVDLTEDVRQDLKLE